MAGTAKTGQSRVLPLNDEAREVLANWKPEAAQPEDPVFGGAEGEPRQRFKTSWAGVLKTAKVEEFRFHDLRHHFASRLVQAGVDLNRVRALLGHADTKMVMRYAHLRDEDLAAAVAKLARA